MSSTASPTRRALHPHSLPPSGDVAPDKSSAAPTAYGRPFWLALASSFAISIGIAMLYRYADFVTLLGGNEFHLGWITGIGMSGSLVVRLALGSWIDRYGTRTVWLGSTLLMAVSCAGHLAIASPTGAGIYFLRILYCSGLAGFTGASITFVSKQGSTQRMAEMIGLLGAAGFSGVIFGTVFSDLLMNGLVNGQEQVGAMFLVAAAANLAAIPFVWFATRREVRPHYTPGPSMFGILRRYRQGPVLMLAAAMGLAIGLPPVFLRTYAADLDIPRISAFFVIYSITALVTRLLTRRWPEQFGNRPVILLGSGIMVVSLLLFLPVHSEWQLMLPAFGFGGFHAILFPALMAAGSATFPTQYRGLATVLMLAMFDFGQLVGSPAAGIVLSSSERVDLPPYPTMFVTIGSLLAIVSLWYALVSRRTGD